MHKAESRISLLYLALGFVIAALLLDAQALVVWAQRLPVGPVREAALEATGALHSLSSDLGTTAIRASALASLGREGASPPATPPAEPPLAELPPAVVVASAPEPSSGADATLRLRPSTQPPKPRADDNALGIALMGDSMMAVGLAPYLKRTLGRQENLRLISAFRSGTGLARPEVFDWIAEYPKLLDGQQVNLVICAMGANDAQGFVENGKVQAFGSPGWESIYRQRVSNLAKLLTRDGARVIWLSLPVMRSEEFSSKTARINKVVQEALADLPGVTLVDANSVLADESGHFRAYSKDAKGKMVSLRQRDGIHVTDAGARLLAEKLLPMLEAASPLAVLR